MREPKAAWLAQLRAVDAGADLRWNEAVSRWEFILTSADGVPRSQFWCQFDGPRDWATGLQPFRELDDDSMREACANLERTFIGNPFDGAGTTRREAMRRYTHNRDLQAKRFREAGELFAEYVWDHRRQLRDAGAGPLVTVA